MLACGEREAMVMAPPPMHDSAVSPYFHGCLAFLHRHFQPQPPPLHPLDLSLHSQQQPLPWDCSTIPKFQLQAAVPSRRSTSLSGVCMAAARTVWFSFHLSCNKSALSLSALNFSSLTQTIASMWGLDPCFSPPSAKGGSDPTNTPVFPLVSLCYRVLHGSIYSFLLVRHSCQLSAGVLHELLCLKVYSWCNHGERCTPHLPVPLPSCSHQFIFDQQLKWLFFHVCICAKSLQWSDSLSLYGL